MTEKITILDTTLRDGEQSPGFGMNDTEKVSMAIQLESLGVDIIEAGFPAASPGDAASVCAVAEKIKKCSVAALARALPDDIAIAAKSLSRAVKPRIHIFMATSDLHLQYKLKMTREEALEKIISSIKLAKEYNMEVEFSCEDASRTDIDFLVKVADSAFKAGADVVDLPDTVGFATPHEIFTMVETILDKVPLAREKVIAVHCHNDLGLAVANTLSGIMAGAKQIECTIGGIGERAGNAAVEEVVMGLKTRHDFYKIDTGIKTDEIMRTSNLLSSITGIKPSPSKAIIGRNAFSHESGIHQHGVLAKPSTYEIINPETVGVMDLSIVLGKHSGRHAVTRHLSELGFDSLSEDDVTEIFRLFKILADSKKVVTDKDLVAITENLIRVESGEMAWKLESFVVNSGNTIKTTACLRLSKDGKIYEEVATGIGPVFAIVKAIESIIKHPFNLVDYHLEAVTERRDALGEARVKISNKHGTFRGRGVSTDVIEATVRACVAAVNAMLKPSKS